VSGYLSQVLGETHHLDAFTCGKGSLDEWLRNQALRAQGAGTARTYVWTRPDSRDVSAYFSIAPTQIVRSEAPRPLTGGYSVIPAYLLARLVLDRALHGRGLGGDLLLDALARIVDAAAVGGGRLIVVDAMDEQAAAFYRRHDFVRVGGSSRLYLKVATARSVLVRPSDR
jgi:GNAT superfamily N-acetyltransferase